MHLLCVSTMLGPGGRGWNGYRVCGGRLLLSRSCGPSGRDTTGQLIIVQGNMKLSRATSEGDLLMGQWKATWRQCHRCRVRGNKLSRSHMGSQGEEQGDDN